MGMPKPLYKHLNKIMSLLKLNWSKIRTFIRVINIKIEIICNQNIN